MSVTPVQILVCFEGDKEYFLALQSPEENGEGGQISREVGEAKIEVIERLKNAKTLYNMGMKVAAVALMCQDPGVFNAMKMAGTPCPYKGKIGIEAAKAWAENPEKRPDYEKWLKENDLEAYEKEWKNKATTWSIGIGALLLFLL
mgnify:CR=1 FL=1